ncbi:MAG: NfeD family protein, partial [Candidatus Omnitrophota bacterium]|nr:NfeD family protein [Candidatus Omnitrophota bacterium]
PNIAYILLILGFYGLLYEVTHPGFGLPGVLGFIFLVLAFYSMQTLPTNYAGLALIILGLILLIAEMFVPGFGLMTLGGLVCLFLGSILLFESVDPVMRVSRSLILGFSATTAAITFILLSSVLRAHRRKAKGGKEGLLEEVGEARTSLRAHGKGKIFVHGEIWDAIALEDIAQGDPVEIVEVSGLTLKVRNKKERQ